MNCIDTHRAIWANMPKRERHQPSGWREDDCAVKLFWWRSVRFTHPRGTQFPGMLLVFDTARKHRYFAAPVPRYLNTQMPAASEAIDS